MAGPYILCVLALIVSLANSVVAATGLLRLGDETLDEFVENLPQDELLFVDFFKNSCRACQRLSPVLDFLDVELEREEPDPSKRWFKIAKVDVEKNPRMASIFGIKSLPDIRFVRAGQWATYEGGKTLEDIKDFKKRMALAPLPAVDQKGLLELVSSNDAVFVLATETDADPAAVAPEVVVAANTMQHVATFCTATQEVLTSLGLGSKRMPALLKVVASPVGQGNVLQPTVFGGDAIGASTTWKVSRWVEQESYALVSNFTPDNFSRLGSLGRLVVIGIINPRDAPATAAFKEDLEKVAAGLGLSNSDKLIFGTMDGNKLAGFAETFNIYEGLPRLVVLDMPEDTFYTVENMRLETGEMEAFIIDVLSGGIPGQTSSVNWTRYLMKICWVVQKGGAWSLLLLLPVIGFFWVFCDTPAAEEAREALRLSKRHEQEAQRLKND